MNSSRFDTLHAAVKHYGSVNPDRIAYCYPGQSDLSYGQLYQRANALAQLLISRCERGDRVIIALPTAPEFMVSYLACGLAGVVAVPTFLPVPGRHEEYQQNLQRIIESAAARLMLLNSQEETSLHKLLLRLGIERLCLDNLPEAPETNTQRQTELAMILYTSGSTGWPKGVQITHQNLLTNYAAFADRFTLTQTDKVCTWLPNCHIAGFYLRTLALPLGGSTVVFPANEFIQRPAYWLEAINDHGVSISAAPNFAYDIIAKLDPSDIRQDLDLSHWKMAITGGEVVREDTVNGILAQLKPLGFAADAFFLYYGMTETLCTSIRLPETQLNKISIDKNSLMQHRAVLCDEEENSIPVISNGQILLPDSVKIVDVQAATECQHSEIGEIWIRNDTVTPGYWQQEDLNREVCRAELENSDDRYFRTGDLGFLHENQLFITGRIKELIILNGKNYYPKDIEASIIADYASTDILPVALACQQNGQECLGILVECAAEIATDATAAQLRALISKKHGVVAEIILFFRPETLPRTSTGKIQRQQCRQLVNESNETSEEFSIPPVVFERKPFLELNEQQQQQSFQQCFLHLCSEIVNRDCRGIDAALELESLGLDSLQLVRLLSRAREVFALELEIASFYEQKSIKHFSSECVTRLKGGDHVGNEPPVEYDEQLNQVLSAVYEQLPTRTESGTVLLTGATGFLGSYLLQEILKYSDWQVVCLVRGASEELALQRVVNSLQEIEPQASQNSSLSRLEVVCGEIDQPLLGIAREKYQALAKRVDRIIHNAANVNFVAPFKALRSANVGGVANVIEFACCENLKLLHFVSTTAVLNSVERDQYRQLGEKISLNKGEDIYSGYAQSKWAGEKLLDVAAAAGVPVSIFRPGLVMGAENSGHCHTDDFLCRFIKGCLQLGCFPAIESQLDITPVDYVAAAIVGIAAKLPNRRLPNHYNLVNPSRLSVKELALWLASTGYDLEIVASGEWHERLATIQEDNALYPLLPFLLQRKNAGQQTILEFFSSRPLNISRENTDKVCDQPCPPIDHRLLEVYLDYFQRTDFIAKPQALDILKRKSA